MYAFSRPWWRLAFIGLLLTNSASYGEVETSLPPGARKKLELQVVPAYRAGNSLSIVRVLGPLIDRLDGKQRSAADSLLQSYQLPALDELLLEARLALLPFEPDRRIPVPGRYELRMLVKALGERIQEVMELKLPSDKEDVPGTLDRFEKRLWEYEAAAGQLEQAAGLARYGHDLLASVSRRAGDSSHADSRRATVAFHRLVLQVEEKQHDLAASMIRMRLARLQLADTMLRKKTGYADRLAAAYLIDVDTEQCRQLAEQPAAIQQPDLLSPARWADLEERAEQLRQSEPELLTAAAYLFRGLEWWMRGRYGVGPEGQGLLKSELALWSPEAQFGIYLPSQPPHPTVPGESDAESIPKFQRRHHWIWLYEYRQVPLSGKSAESGSLDSNAQVRMSQYYSGADQLRRTPEMAKMRRTSLRAISRQLTPEDAHKVNRLVGYLEYGKALEYLDALVAQRSVEELQSLDEWIQYRDELVIYTSLVPELARPQQPKGGDSGGPPIERRGLAWVMALARLELAAMAATFTPLPQPFAAVRPTSYELPQYRQLLAEAFQEHYFALQHDELLRRLAQGQGTPTDLLRYGRRLVLTKALWQALWQQTQADAEAQDVYQLISTKAELDATERVLLLRLGQFIQGLRQGSSLPDGSLSLMGQDADKLRVTLQGN